MNNRGGIPTSLMINYVRPLDRPGQGWFWQFSLPQGP